MGFSVRWCVELEESIEYYSRSWRNGVRLCGDATTRGIASCFGASMTLCRRSGVQSPRRCFSLTDRWLPPELICPNHGVENGDEFPHRSGERHLLEFSFRQQSLIEGFDRRVKSRGNECCQRERKGTKREHCTLIQKERKGDIVL